ncbi:MAG: aminopeptidase [Candidatus Fournierella pullistercoris]|uniref:M18 family aminopeptidase n=1 Tax=Candidatus Allofournierella pullistercoris TaxID=2838597 RepID=A0A948T3J9_9FIRM|nr:aminopeptidase [Candidatus Fournierella pullistercoris]
MNQEKTQGQLLAEQLLYKAPIVADKDTSAVELANEFCEGYKVYLDESKTEREAVEYSVQLLTQAGYKPFVPGTCYQPGDKIYMVNRGKALIAATIGSYGLERGAHLNISHIDAPRIDLKPSPLYESADLALLKTHYYGGIRKYQWTATPLALHGVVYKADGEKVVINIGEKPGDPVFCITDLLPHLGAEQNARTLKGGITGEELNILVGGLPYEDEAVKERVKLMAMKLLNERYGITERDFARAEIEAVPAQKAADVGLDRSFVGAYGQDDRVDAYAALIAEIEVKNPAFTTICVLADKEETGSDGATGLQGMYVFHFMQQLCAAHGVDSITCFQASKCLSADVSAAFDPTFAKAFDPLNSTYAGKGLALCRYVGSAGKVGTNDAGAELMTYFTKLFDDHDVVWQTGEMGRVDLGGGGTVSKYVSKHDIDTLDVGVPVLSMHSPFEITSKLDVYMAYKAFKAFNETKE